MKINATEIAVVRGSVLEQDVDAIVNAANTSMRGGGGVDGAVHDAAGRELLAELKAVAPDGAPTGAPVLTGGHNLKQKHIIHVAGPVWSAQRADECERLLRACYRGALEVAEGKEWGSLAFCSISTGIYGYPLSLAAPLAVETVADYLRTHPQTTLRRVVFAMFQSAEYRVFQEALRTLENTSA
jgi:O-acetyl-ADP-ribose deacetylase (regulator of RNase III)